MKREKCFNCKSEKGTQYLSAGHWLCEHCYDNLVKETLPPKVATRRIDKNKKNGGRSKRGN